MRWLRFLLVVVGLSSTAFAATLDVNPSRDKCIESADALNCDQADGDATTLPMGNVALKSGNAKVNGLFTFDVSSIPAGSTITSAELTFEVTVVNDADEPFEIARLTRPTWDETNATWTEYDSGSSWTTNGGDYSTPTKSFTGPTSTGPFTVTGLASWVQDCVDNRSGDCHMHIRKTSASTDDYFTSYSSEGTTPPELSIVYTPADTPTPAADTATPTNTPTATPTSTPTPTPAYIPEVLWLTD